MIGSDGAMHGLNQPHANYAQMKNAPEANGQKQLSSISSTPSKMSLRKELDDLKEQRSHSQTVMQEESEPLEEEEGCTDPVMGQ